MSRGDLLRRSAKLIATLAMMAGLSAAFMGLVGGYSMGGAILHGDPYGDALRLAFIVLPLAATCLFAFAIVRDNGRPIPATLIYAVVLGLVAIQLALPALQ